VTITVASVNDAPVALAQSYTTAEDTQLTGTTVLAGASDLHAGAPGENNGPLTAELVTGVTHGALTLDADGTFTYTPAKDYNGADTFTFKALDALGGKSDVVTVTLTVASVNDAPWPWLTRGRRPKIRR